MRINMKKVMMMLALAGCTLGAMSLSSCGSDSDNNNGGNTGGETKGTPAYWTFEAIYGADASTYPDTKNVFDISVQYPDGNGGTKTETGVEQNTTNKVATATYQNSDGTTTKVDLMGKKFSFTSKTFGGSDVVTFTQAIKSSYVYTDKVDVDYGFGYAYTVYDAKGNVIKASEVKMSYEKKTGISNWESWSGRFPKTVKYTISASKDGTITVNKE